MGVGVIAGLALAAFSTVNQIKTQKKARKAQKEARAVSGANEEIKNRLARREEAKRLRITRGRIAASADASGVGESSGELGATSAATSASNASIGFQQSQVLAARGISAANQREADAISKGKTTQAFLNLLGEGIGIAEDEGLFS